MARPKSSTRTWVDPNREPGRGEGLSPREPVGRQRASRQKILSGAIDTRIGLQPVKQIPFDAPAGDPAVDLTLFPSSLPIPRADRARLQEPRASSRQL